MSTSIFTVEAKVEVYDDVAQRWTGSRVVNALTLEITKPEPTILKDQWSTPDEKFAQTKETYTVSTNAPTIEFTTRDITDANRTNLELLAADLSARLSALTVAGATNLGFSADVAGLDRDYPTGHRNLIASSAVIHKQAAITTGNSTGNVTAADATTISDSTQEWTVDELIGMAVMITGGTGAGQVVAITDNDADSVTVASWTTEPDTTSTYAIVVATALTEDADYTVDLLYGDINPLSTGSIAVDDVIHGLVDKYGYTANKFQGGVKSNVIWRMRGKGKDMKQGTTGFLTIHRVVSYDTEAKAFVANVESPAFRVASLSGEMETPEGEMEPYIWEDDIVYATS